MIEYAESASPSRRLQGGERFLVVLERRIGLTGMSRIDTMVDAWQNAGTSRWLYVVGPPLETVKAADQKVGGLVLRARAEAAQTPVVISSAFQDLQQHLGFMQIRRVEALDLKDVNNIERQAGVVEKERQEGAGGGLLGDAKRTAQEIFGKAAGIVKIAIALGVIIGGVELIRFLREARK